MSRRHDPRRAKSHRSYDFAEIAETFDVTIGTARKWRKEGLLSIDDKRPYIFAGEELASFLKRKNKPRQPLQPGQIYCVADKVPCSPKSNEARVRPATPTSVQLIGKCPNCGREVHRRVRIVELREKAGNLNLRYEDASVPIGNDGGAPRTVSNEEDAA